jgi:hypothetical protein
MPTRNSSSGGSLRSEIAGEKTPESGVIRFGNQGGLNLFKNEEPFWMRSRKENMTADQRLQIINEERANYTETMNNLKAGLRHLDALDMEAPSVKRNPIFKQMFLDGLDKIEKNTKRAFGLKTLPDAKIGVNSPELKDAVKALFETRAGGYTATEKDFPDSNKGFSVRYNEQKGGFIIGQDHHIDDEDGGGENTDDFYLLKSGNGPEGYYKAQQIVHYLDTFAPKKITDFFNR